MANIPVGTYINAFDQNTFTKNFLDPNEDRPCEVMILSLPDPSKGKLYFNLIPVEVNFTFNYKESDKLTYLRISELDISDSFEFKISDNNQNKLYSNMATVTINISAYTNLPPDSVGNLNVTINHAATKVFTTADFTTGLSPAYHDPEGDAPSKLKVLSLPNSGLLKLNGVNVIVNQEIPFANITSGLFIYVSDGTVNSAINTSFNFAISDTGSGIFTS